MWRATLVVVSALALPVFLVAPAAADDHLDARGGQPITLASTDEVASAGEVVLADVVARGTDRVCPPPAGAGDEVDQAQFADRGEVHGEAILCAAAYGLIGGFGDGTFRPGLEITRAQTATALARWLEAATGFPVTADDPQPFPDVAGTHAPAVAALAEAGIIGGRADGTFGPDEPLTRGQFAQVVVRAISYADTFTIDGPLPVTPSTETLPFEDLAGSVFATDVTRLAGARIAAGLGDGRFGVSGTVTRGQLATFLMRSADYLDRHQRWKPTARTVTLLADLEVWADGDETAEGSDGASSETADGAVASVTGRASVVLVVNAFNGTIAWALDASDVVPLLDEDTRLAVRVGARDGDGAVAVVLGRGSELGLGAGSMGTAIGTVVEADSSVRFADITASPGGAFVELRAQDLVGGSLRGSLRAAG